MSKNRKILIYIVDTLLYYTYPYIVKYAFVATCRVLLLFMEGAAPKRPCEKCVPNEAKKHNGSDEEG